MIAAANAPAADAGLAPGMALADARAILPSVRTVAAEPAAERTMIRWLADWCGRYSPWVAVDVSTPHATISGDASIRMDITGCAHLFGGEEALLRDLTGRIAALGFTARAAAADTPGAAWAICRYAPASAPWLIVPPGEVRQALEPLPVAALRLPPESIAGLEALGLERIADLLLLPRAALAARFGDEIADRLDQALGRRPEPVSPDLPVAPHFAHIAFPEPVAQSDGIAAALERLVRCLCAGLERGRRGARRLVFTLYEPAGGIRSLSVGVSRPSRDPDHLTRLFTEHLGGVETAFGFDALTLFAPLTEALGARQTDLVTDGGRSAGPGEIDRLADRLSNRLGAASVLRLFPRESHVPERSVRPRPALERRNDGRPAVWPHAKPFAQHRPPRLLPRPEPIEAVAPVPDDPPVMFRWRKATFRVARAEGPERITPEWWLADANRVEAQREKMRDYYRVEDTSGRRFWLYREGLYRPDRHPAWFMHGVGG